MSTLDGMVPKLNQQAFANSLKKLDKNLDLDALLKQFSVGKDQKAINLGNNGFTAIYFPALQSTTRKTIIAKIR